MSAIETPSTKVTAATVAAAVSTFVIWLVTTYTSIDVPEAATLILVSVLTGVFGYFIKERNPASSSLQTPPSSSPS
jgi:hypothetical protein